MSQPDVTDVLEQDHRELRSLFSSWYRTANFDGQRQLVRRAVIAQLRHARDVRAHVIPALREAGGEPPDELLMLQEHAEAVMNHLDEAPADDVNYHLLVVRLVNDLRFQMHREETTAYPRLREALSDETRAELGERLRESKESAPGWPDDRSADDPPFSARPDSGATLVERVTAWLSDEESQLNDAG